MDEGGGRPKERNNLDVVLDVKLAPSQRHCRTCVRYRTKMQESRSSMKTMLSGCKEEGGDWSMWKSDDLEDCDSVCVEAAAEHQKKERAPLPKSAHFHLPNKLQFFLARFPVKNPRFKFVRQLQCNIRSRKRSSAGHLQPATCNLLLMSSRTQLFPVLSNLHHQALDQH